MYVTMLTYGRAVGEGGAIQWHLVDLAGLVATWLFFLVLRIVDEHVDYASDRIDDPGNIMRRHKVSLTELKLIAAVAVATQFAVMVWRDDGFGRVTLWWTVALLWTVLTALDFFVRSWIVRRSLIEMVMHTLIMPLSAVWMMQFGRGVGELPLRAASLAGAAFLTSIAFELVRKLSARTGDTAGLASPYAQALGGWLSVTAVGALLLGSFVMAHALMALPDLDSEEAIIALIATVVPAAIAAIRFAHYPDDRSAKYVRATVGIAVVLQQVIVVISLVTSRGISM
jgi:hypothetical protein